MKFAPVAVIKRPHREDYVFLRREDMQQDYPSDASVEVIGFGGVVMATKEPGPTKLTLSDGIDVEKCFLQLEGVFK